MDATQTLPACASWIVPRGEIEMREWQARRCAFCGYEERLVRDHDHATGLIRGLLCTGCNVGEAFNDSPAWDLYRDGVNPAGILAMHEVYVTNPPGIVEQAIMRARESDPIWQRDLAWASL
jgi:hypothetical protein